MSADPFLSHARLSEVKRDRAVFSPRDLPRVQHSCPSENGDDPESGHGQHFAQGEIDPRRTSGRREGRLYRVPQTLSVPCRPVGDVAPRLAFRTPKGVRAPLTLGPDGVRREESQSRSDVSYETRLELTRGPLD